MLIQRRNQHMHIYEKNEVWRASKNIQWDGTVTREPKKDKSKKNPVQMEPEIKQNFKQLYISIAPTYIKIIVTKTLMEEAGFNGKSVIKLVEQPIIIDIIIWK